MRILNMFVNKGDEITSKCNAFFQELVELSNDILFEEDRNQQWEKLKEFLIEYRRRHEAAIEAGVWWQPCSLETVSKMLDTLEQLRHRGVPIYSLLLNLMMNILDVKWCRWGQNSYPIPWRYQFENSNVIRSSNDCETEVLYALSHKPEFMEFLMRFGFVSSLSDESSLLQKATHGLMQDFL